MKLIVIIALIILVSCDKPVVKFDTHTDHISIRKGVVTRTCGNLYKSGSYVISLLDNNNNFTGAENIIDYNNNKKFNFSLGKDTVFIKIHYNKSNQVIASFLLK